MLRQIQEDEVEERKDSTQARRGLNPGSLVTPSAASFQAPLPSCKRAGSLQPQSNTHGEQTPLHREFVLGEGIQALATSTCLSPPVYYLCWYGHQTR